MLLALAAQPVTPIRRTPIDPKSLYEADCDDECDHGNRNRNPDCNLCLEASIAFATRIASRDKTLVAIVDTARVGTKTATDDDEIAADGETAAGDTGMFEIEVAATLVVVGLISGDLAEVFVCELVDDAGIH
ncbi:hypothetical protein HK096_006808 [Nowakowskiella sp. JEL0078]|nr:hypothetical protein HK096_006808 [Nowakowskiella sp. JEL0078]